MPSNFYYVIFPFFNNIYEQLTKIRVRYQLSWALFYWMSHCSWLIKKIKNQRLQNFYFLYLTTTFFFFFLVKKKYYLFLSNDFIWHCNATGFVITITKRRWSKKWYGQTIHEEVNTHWHNNNSMETIVLFTLKHKPIMQKLKLFMQTIEKVM